MVSLTQVLSSNARIPQELPSNMVAVFAGATTGIGLATLKAFVKYAVSPRIYFLARNTTAAELIVSQCQTLNPSSSFSVLKADLSSVRETSRACEVIKSKETGVNLVVLSMGEVRMDRALSEEGLHLFMATVYYNRILIPSLLLPQLTHASLTTPLARVLDVAGGTKEGPVDTSDLACLRVPVGQIRAHLTSMHTLALESLADQAPSCEVCAWGGGGGWSGVGDGVEGGQPTEEVRRSVYSVDWDGEGPGGRVMELLKKLRKKGVKEAVWEHTNGEFERIRSGRKL
ncbi:uncharacterized protein N0V89_003509 [Didymosphaeria variabile]|uniref:NAD(P)-binding protein n=1 Tax=Didymosphaeria variabile TaxID=1932322 RepID=A0A9W9CCD8_9PLEO|nr:uncharacterized protein N0V89_003509 [Didymosphaeria variabile]KAJ4355493.1 hypothetical protein N0V89_003509 [Didymosphaeria variabile]